MGSETVPPAAPLATPRLDQVIDRMEDRLRELTEANDRRRRFLRMYAIFKRRLRQNIRAGRFLEAAWAEAVCCSMAEYYLEAGVAYERVPPVSPPAWTYCFDLALSGTTNVLQDMLLGMNAHINYDLPFCTRDTLRQFGDLRSLNDGSPETRLAFDANLRRRYFDFLLINEIAWESLPAIQDIMCREFSRPLGIVNAASFRVSRKTTEKLICDYRDRAWSHTLLLATAKDETEAASVTRFISDFTMDIGLRVELLTLRPMRLAASLSSRRRRVRTVDRYRPHVQLHVAQLQRPVLGKISRRALLEYGHTIQPILAENADDENTPTQVRRKILAILAERPSATAARALCRQLALGREDVQFVLPLLVSLRAEGVRLDLDRTSLLPALERKAERRRQLLGCLRDLGEDARESLLGETLLREIGELDELLATANELLSPAWSLVEAPSPVDCEPEGARLAKLAEAESSWLRVCALQRIGERRLSDLAPVAERALGSGSTLVAETALWTCAQLLEANALAAVLASYLTSGDRPAWRYASSIHAQDPSRLPMLSTIEKVLYLKHVELFRDIPSENLAEIAQVADERTFERSQELIRQGAPGEELYVVVDGEVDVLLGGQRLARVGSSGVLGEMSIVSDAPAFATCVAAGRGRALHIRRSDFHRLLLDYPEIAAGLIRVLSDRLRGAQEKL